MSGRHVIIVGGGASGVLLAAHLLRLPDSSMRVSIVERDSAIGRGVAYATAEPDHILNTRVGSMSAYTDDPDHFWRWLLGSGAAADARCADPFCFVPRKLFARYLNDLVAPWRAKRGDGRLVIVRGECVDLRETPHGIAVELADGTTRVGRMAVIATGHDLPKLDADGRSIDAWTPPAAAGIQPDDRILVLGTGLSMVDAVVGFANAGHRGRITALSRHGLLPQTHRRTMPLRIDAADVPFGTEISYLLRWFRQMANWAVERGGDWRDVMDGVRPHTAPLWQSLSPAARSRFLRHARTWWEMHRHRLPPESEVRLRAAISNGLLELVRGRVVDIARLERGAHVAFRRTGSPDIETATVARIIDCTGLLRASARDADGPVGRLLARGAARTDALQLGLDVDDRCAVIDGAGKASSRIFAVGPVTKARFWEVTAVPDIRLQCARLAGELAASLATGADDSEAARPERRR